MTNQRRERRGARAFTTAIAVFALLGAGSGCGYRFAAGGGGLPEGVTVVTSPIFENHTAEPGLEAIFTQALREQLLRSGVDARASADAQLQGAVIWVGGGPTILTTPDPSTGRPGTLASYRIHASAKLTLLKGERVLATTEISGSEDYLPGVDVLDSETNRQAALRRLAQRLMRDGYDRLTLRE